MKNKKDLVSKAMEMTEIDITEKDAEMFINAFLNLIKLEVKKGNEVSIGKFGKFIRVLTKEKKARNPKTNEEIMVEPFLKVKFRPSINFKEFVKNK